MQTAWTRAGVQPHRFERSMRSDDPDFEPNAADVIGLILQKPQHAAVFAADEKTAIQALDRFDPVLPLSPAAPSAMGLHDQCFESSRTDNARLAPLFFGAP